MNQPGKPNMAKFAAKAKVVTKPRSARIRAEAAPFVSKSEMRAFAASQVKYKLADLKPAKNRKPTQKA